MHGVAQTVNIDLALSVHDEGKTYIVSRRGRRGGERDSGREERREGEREGGKRKMREGEEGREGERVLRSHALLLFCRRQRRLSLCKSHSSPV